MKKVYGKKFICFICSIAMLLTVCNVKDTVDAAVKKTTSTIVYITFCSEVSSFVKKNGKLTVKATYDFDVEKWKNGEFGEDLNVKTKKITFPLAKNCKWTYDYIGDLKPDAKISYSKLKKTVQSEYKENLKNGYFDSPTRIFIFVKNKKIIEVRASIP